MLEQTPTVSVIIPSYNHARFLDKRISTVLNQTFQDFEIIYLDDASTDDSNLVFAKFAGDPRIRSILNKTNTGNPFKQWNKGIREARGKYIWVAESDDYADETLLETLVNALEKYPTSGIAYCQSWEVDENDQILSNYQWVTDEHDSERWKHDFVNNGVDECSQYMVLRNTIPNASAVVFRKSIYEAIGGAPETMKLCGDWLFWCKMALESDVAFVSEPLNFFRKASSKGARGIAGREGLFIEEKFQVIQCISHASRLSEKTLLKTLHRQTYFWMEYTLTKGIPLTRQQSIYRIARGLDRKIDFTLANQMITVGIKLTLRAFGITHYIKRLYRRQTAQI